VRVIDLDLLKLPKDWQKDANAAIAAGVDKIDQHAKVWQRLKSPLKKLSHRKCFYCEMIQIRSDGAVDHFRPKSKYPWSAFRETNYRFSCTFCNSRRKDEVTGKSGGKGDNFPLPTGSKPATSLADEDDESPMLIDPCVSKDPGLIDFDETGMPVPAYSITEHKGRHDRAAISITLYNLDHTDLVEERKKLAIKIARLVKLADKLFPLTEAGNPAIDASFAKHVNSLANRIDERAELSAFARRILSGYRDRRWVDRLLLSA